MELKSIYGDVIFALEGAKTLLELVSAAVVAKKPLRGAYLGGASLRGAYLGGASLRGASLCGASLCGAHLRGADLRAADLRAADLGGAHLRGAYLGGAHLRGADLRGAYLGGAYLGGKKIAALRAFSGSLYPYEAWAVLYEDGTRAVTMGCHFNTLEEWASIDLRSNNISEFPDDGSEISEERVGLFELAKAAALRMKMPVAVPQQESEERK